MEWGIFLSLLFFCPRALGVGFLQEMYSHLTESCSFCWWSVHTQASSILSVTSVNIDLWKMSYGLLPLTATHIKNDWQGYFVGNLNIKARIGLAKKNILNSKGEGSNILGMGHARLLLWFEHFKYHEFQIFPFLAVSLIYDQSFPLVSFLSLS